MDLERLGTRYGRVAAALLLLQHPLLLAIRVYWGWAYATSDAAVFHTLRTDFWCYEGTELGDCVVLAAPFQYWFTAALVLVLGPGLFALDGAIGVWWRRRYHKGAGLPRLLA